MSISQQLILIGVMVLATQLTRALPFVAFPADKPTPKYITFLGKALPAAIFGMLVVYCLKNVNLLAFSFGIPELIAIVFVVALHLWKRQHFLTHTCSGNPRTVHIKNRL